MPDPNTIIGTELNESLIGTEGADILRGLAGDDYLSARGGDDILIGGTGDDLLQGDGGNDTYLFGAGSAHDKIQNDGDAATLDIVEFDATVDRNNVRLERNGADLIITVAGTSDRILVENNHLNFSWDRAIDGIRFADGVFWDRVEMARLLNLPTDADQVMWGSDGADSIAGGGGNDIIIGDDGNDVTTGGAGDDSLSGGRGNDSLDGGDGSDTLSGGEGNDLLVGGAGNDYLTGDTGDDILVGGAGNDLLIGSESDTYRFSAGFGEDIIRHTRTANNDVAMIELDASIARGDLRLERLGGSLFISVEGAPEDVVEVEYHFGYGGGHAIDGIRFADGVVWDRSEIIRVINQPTDEAQWMLGSELADVIDGGGGDDYIFADAGDDIVSGGDGNDDLDGDAGNDTLHGGDGQDEIYGGEGNDILYGGAGDDIYLIGEAGDDILIGGAGNDRLYGREGNDIYRFEAGFGQDEIGNEDWDPSSIDVVEFTGDLVSTMFGVALLDGNLVLSAGDQKVTLNYFEQYQNLIIDEVRFADGVTWTVGDLMQLAMQPNDADQQFRGTEGADALSGGGGNDTLYGLGGDDILDGDEDDDTLMGGAGDDILIGGTGNDYLEGGEGSDIYRFGLGFGSDVIHNLRDRYNSGTQDVIEFDAGIPSSSLAVSRVGDDMELRFDGFPGDVVRVIDFYQPLGNLGNHIDEVRFADGTVIGYAELNRLGNLPSEDNQVIYGTEFADTLDAGGGNDFIYGMAGDDDLTGGGGEDRLYGAEGNDSLHGGDGDDYLAGDEGNDLLDGGRGDDTLEGGSGDDTYYYVRGNGVDYVYSSYISGNDGVLFGPGLTAADVVLIDDGTDLTFRTLGDSGGIVFQYYQWYQPGVSLRFSDGTALDAAQVQAAILVKQEGTALGDTLSGNGSGDYLLGLGGKDTLLGGEGNDLLEGGAGDDSLVGGLGNDTYYFESGWGKDVIRVQDALVDGVGLDRIYFAETITAADLIVGSTATDLTLTHRTTGDRITLGGFFSLVGQDGDRVVDEVRFADGTLWSVEDMISGQQVGTSAAQYIHGRGISDTIDADGGNDLVFGYAGDDILDGGTGNDRLEGGSGSDTYRFQLGWGQDLVVASGPDAAATDVDVIAFGVGVTANHIGLVSNVADLTLQHVNGDRITLERFFTDPGAIQEVRFDDGTTWTVADLYAQQMVGNDSDQYQYGTAQADQIQGLGGNDLVYGRGGADVLDGGDGDDVLDGGAGNDVLHGGDGNDMFVFSAGSGQDRLISQDPDGIYWDVVQLGEGIISDQIGLSRDGRDVVLSLTGTDDSLTLVDFLPEIEGDWPTAIDEVWFADGTVWDAYSIIGALPAADVSGGAELQSLVAAMAVSSASSSSFDAGPLLWRSETHPGLQQVAHAAI